MRIDSDRITWQELDGEAVVLDLAGSRYFSLNRTGTILLELMREDRELSELVDALVCEFGEQGSSRITADVSLFLDDLRRRGLLVE